MLPHETIASIQNHCIFVNCFSSILAIYISHLKIDFYVQIPVMILYLTDLFESYPKMELKSLAF